MVCERGRDEVGKGRDMVVKERGRDEVRMRGMVCVREVREGGMR